MAETSRSKSPAAPLVLMVALSTMVVGALVIASPPLSVWLLSVVLGLVLVVGAASSIRRELRRDLEASTAEAVAPLLAIRSGADASAAVKLRRWPVMGWPGAPAHVELRYQPAAADDDPSWTAKVRSKVEVRLGSVYEVKVHDQVRRRLVLTVPRASGADVDGEDESQLRAGRAISRLMGATAKITDFETSQTGEATAFVVAHQESDRFVPPGYRARIERAVSAMHAGRWRAQWDLEQDTVRFERRPMLPESIWLEPGDQSLADDLLANYGRVRLPLAVDEDQNPVTWTPSKLPHLMLVGSTGSGKTSTVQALVALVTGYGWPVWIADPKRVEFLGFREWPNVQIVATTAAQQAAMVHRAFTIMEERYRLFEEDGVSPSTFEPLFIVLDEYAEFRASISEWYSSIKVKGDPAKPATFAEVARIARKGRTARVHLVLGTQRPDAEFLGGEMRDNFRMRVSLGRLSPQGAMMMWENHTVGVALPSHVTGRATVLSAAGVPIEAQAFRFPDITTSDPAELELLEQHRPATVLHERIVYAPPEEDAFDEAPTFRDYQRAPFELASKRPDLDPVVRRAESTGDVDGTSASSPLAILGLLGSKARPPVPASSSRAHLRAVRSDEPVDVDHSGAVDEPVDAYAPAAPMGPWDITVGDLVELEIDEGDLQWVVVDEEPVEDAADEGLVALSWRSDADDSGSTSLDADELLQVRRPVDLFDEEKGISHG